MWIETEIEREKEIERNDGTAVETISETGMEAETGTGARAKDGAKAATRVAKGTRVNKPPPLSACHRAPMPVPSFTVCKSVCVHHSVHHSAPSACAHFTLSLPSFTVCKSASQFLCVRVHQRAPPARVHHIMCVTE